jgi:hypothetical protein
MSFVKVQYKSRLFAYAGHKAGRIYMFFKFIPV